MSIEDIHSSPANNDSLKSIDQEINSYDFEDFLNHSHDQIYTKSQPSCDYDNVKCPRILDFNVSDLIYPEEAEEKDIFYSCHSLKMITDDSLYNVNPHKFDFPNVNKPDNNQSLPNLNVNSMDSSLSPQSSDNNENNNSSNQKIIFKQNRKYSQDKKKEIMEYLVANGPQATTKHFNVSRKSLAQWKKHGIEPQFKVGRPIQYPEVEKQTIEWVQDYCKNNGIFPKHVQIMIFAKKIADPDFKVSKGWCKKFVARNRKNFPFSWKRKINSNVK